MRLILPTSLLAVLALTPVLHADDVTLIAGENTAALTSLASTSLAHAQLQPFATAASSQPIYAKKEKKHGDDDGEDDDDDDDDDDGEGATKKHGHGKPEKTEPAPEPAK